MMLPRQRYPVMAHRLFIFIITTVLFFAFFIDTTAIQAQSGLPISVDIVNGVVVDGACPNPRDSVIYVSIQAAANCAERGDILQVAPGTYLEALTIATDLRIQGASASQSIVNANSLGSVVTVANGITVTLSDLTLTGGSTDYGGGVFTNVGNVEIINSLIAGNTASVAGAGVFTGAGSVTILNSTIADNQLAGEGGGVFTRAGTVTIENSTLSDHVVSASGGGLYSVAGTVSMSNTTVSSNAASSGGGLDSQAATVNLGHVTVAANSSGLATERGLVQLVNTILASNGSASCSGLLNSLGHNIIEVLPVGCSVDGDTTGNLTGVDPLLGVLQDNGGLTATHALLEGSPALEAADAAACAAVDQRGAARPQGSDCDVGAYEGIRGDCNADLLTDAGDISALTLEIFDDDGSDPNSVSGSDFAGDPVGCNANQDLVIDAGDISCLVLVIFDGPGSCGSVEP